MSRIILPGSHQGNGEGITGDFNQIEVYDASVMRSKRIAEIEMKIAGRIGKLLVSKYNNRQWKVIVDIRGGMLIVACDSVSNNKGYHIHTRGRNIHEIEARAVMAAGEILERHELSRNRKFNADNLEILLRDQFDNVITSDSAAEAI